MPSYTHIIYKLGKKVKLLLLLRVDFDEIVERLFDGHTIADVHLDARVFEIFECLGRLLINVAEFGDFGDNVFIGDGDFSITCQDLQDE